MTLDIHSDITQGSDEWHDLRRGIVTASTVAKLLTVGPPGPITYQCPTCNTNPGNPCISLTNKTPTPIKTMHPGRYTFADQLAPTAAPVIQVANTDTARAVTATLTAERISGFTEDTPMSPDMWRGVEAEPIARDLYAQHHAPVTEVGFMIEDRWGFPIGYSPDGLVGSDGLIEIKAPRAKNHMLTILSGEVPAQYMAQLQTGLLVSGREWIDYVSYSGGMPLWVKRVYPDTAWHVAILAAVGTFETAAADMAADFHAATADLPATERPRPLEMMF